MGVLVGATSQIFFFDFYSEAAEEVITPSIRLSVRKWSKSAGNRLGTHTASTMPFIYACVGSVHTPPVTAQCLFPAVPVGLCSTG